METLTSAETLINWRDAAMNESLRGFDYSENSDALLREIRSALPGHTTLLIWPDRTQLLPFLQQEATRFQSLLSTRDDCYDEDQDRISPYLGWYSVQWRGETVEIALTPSTCDSDSAFCIARREETVADFARTLLAYTNRPLGRCLRYAQGWENAPELDAEIGKVTWDDIVLAPDIMAGVRAAVEGFWHYRAAYAAMGFAWRRGILLIGPPGTGKTMISKATAAALPEMPFLYVRDLHERNKREAIKAIFRRARQVAPCILAFEDLDGFVRDENRTLLLNELDGFQNNEGLLIIASTNHPGKIDEALLKRPSRFDRVFHIGPPSLPERAEYCRRILFRSSLSAHLAPAFDIESLALRVAERTEGFTPAYLKEVLISAALQRTQEGAMILDERFAAAVTDQIEELRKHLKRMKDPEALSSLTSSDDALGFRQRD